MIAGKGSESPRFKKIQIESSSKNQLAFRPLNSKCFSALGGPTVPRAMKEYPCMASAEGYSVEEPGVMGWHEQESPIL